MPPESVHPSQIGNNPKISVVLLGAGKPYQGDSPSGLQETPDHRLVLDWIIDAFSKIMPTWHFVGGFHVEDITLKYPKLNYTLNKDWKSTKAAWSLLTAPLTTDTCHFVSYTDVVYSPDVVRKLDQADGDIVLAIDTTWKNRFQGRTRADMEIAEKLKLSDGAVLALGPDLTVEDANAEYAGLAKLTPKAMEWILRLTSDARVNFKDAGLLELFKALKDSGLNICTVDVGGEWAELNAPQDLARYVLGTKAETLERLRPLVRKSVIGEQASFRVREWEFGRDSIIATVKDRFRDKLLAVRSSSFQEDSWTTASAGKFLSLTNVPSTDTEALVVAVDRVIGSYNGTSENNQVLVQEMVLAPVLSGVAFTRTLRTGAPYYVINYDDKSRRTDTVTSGFGENLKVFVNHRATHSLGNAFGPHLPAVIDALRELEGLVGHDSLDAEFAVTDDGAIHIMQLRPIVVNHAPLHVSDTQFDVMLRDAETAFKDRQKAANRIVGTRTLYAIMPDWNPAEMIGTAPRQLALSLYRHLITDEVWAIQRAEYGYRDVRPEPLMTDFIGRPYIDVRTCFNSFIPAALSEGFATRLTDHYLDQLEAHPHLHDKVEFDIVFTSLDFGFDADRQRLVDAGFSPEEIKTLRGCLGRITVDGMDRAEKDLKALGVLKQRHHKILESDTPPLQKAVALLEDCRRWGTLPFAHIARGAFLGTALLRSGMAAGLIPEPEHLDFMQSLETVASRLAHDNDALSRGELSVEEFLDRYGHLRPGTYEITSPTYAENVDQHLSPVPSPPPVEKTTPTFSWNVNTGRRLSEGLRRLNLPGDFVAFDKFLRTVIEGREYGKFVFSRSLSAALDLITKFGKEVGLSRDALSHVSIDHLLTVQIGECPGDPAEWLSKKSEEGRRAHIIAQAIELPPLLTHARDFRAFHFPANQPNYVSLKKITAAVANLTENIGCCDDLDGKILLVPLADPGFDWIFRFNIAGLITKYGGANSHMTIRAAEFGLPAAIGVGEVAFARYCRAVTLELDCAGRQIKVIG